MHKCNPLSTSKYPFVLCSGMAWNQPRKQRNKNQKKKTETKTSQQNWQKVLKKWQMYSAILSRMNLHFACTCNCCHRLPLRLHSLQNSVRYSHMKHLLYFIPRFLFNINNNLTCLHGFIVQCLAQEQPTGVLVYTRVCMCVCVFVHYPWREKVVICRWVNCIKLKHNKSVYKFQNFPRMHQGLITFYMSGCCFFTASYIYIFFGYKTESWNIKPHAELCFSFLA